MCNQFQFHHKFKIDTGRTKFWQGQTDGILHSHESHASQSSRSNKAWSDQTTSCILQAKVESAPRYGVLGRFTACSTKSIEILSNKIERSHPLRYTSRFVRGLFSATVPNSSFVKVHMGLLIEPTHMEDEHEDQEN